MEVSYSIISWRLAAMERASGFSLFNASALGLRADRGGHRVRALGMGWPELYRLMPEQLVVPGGGLEYRIYVRELR